MNPPAHRSAPYITQPDAHLAEGEMEVAGASPVSDEQVMTLVTALLRAALDGEPGTDSQPEITSLSLERLAPTGELSGRIYGQAYLERKGVSVHFLRVRLFDERGEPVLSGMATSHIAG